MDVKDNAKTDVTDNLTVIDTKILKLKEERN